MNKNGFDILVTFDQNYIAPFKVMLKSLLMNNPGETVRIWLLHSAIPKKELDELQEHCSFHGVPMTAVLVDRSLFQNAPITSRYPQEMYYRLISTQLLPKSLNKVLYLDIDLLVINPLRPLWEMPLDDYTFAAASHTDPNGMVNGINQIRLNTQHDYYNTGVMLINLERARSLICLEEIFRFVEDHKLELILPDQDVFNTIYGHQTLPLDDAVWNYDARNFALYLLRSSGVYDLNWIMKNTAILHFCGKSKPWSTNVPKIFTALYAHYANLADRQ